MRIIFLHGVLVGFFITTIARCSVIKEFDQELLSSVLKCHAEQSEMVSKFNKDIEEINKALNKAFPMRTLLTENRKDRIK